MTKEQMKECLKKNEEQIKVYSFLVRMANMKKKQREETWEYLESLKFKDEDTFIWWIRFNVSSVI